MASPLHAAGRIAQLRDFLRGEAAAAALGEGAAQALAGACAAWLDGGSAVTLDCAFGVRPARGQSDPRAELRRERRDRLLRDMAALLPGESCSERAGELHRRLLRYHQATWRRDRLAERCPYAPGTVAAGLWEVLKIQPAVLSAERIRRVLAGHEMPLLTTSGRGEAGYGQAEATGE
jgi:hypothetical protein